jgi:hypothetical protein
MLFAGGIMKTGFWGFLTLLSFAAVIVYEIWYLGCKDQPARTCDLVAIFGVLIGTLIVYACETKDCPEVVGHN